MSTWTFWERFPRNTAATFPWSPRSSEGWNFNGFWSKFKTPSQLNQGHLPNRYHITLLYFLHRTCHVLEMILFPNFLLGYNLSLFNWHISFTGQVPCPSRILSTRSQNGCLINIWVRGWKERAGLSGLNPRGLPGRSLSKACTGQRVGGKGRNQTCWAT